MLSLTRLLLSAKPLPSAHLTYWVGYHCQHGEDVRISRHATFGHFVAQRHFGGRVPHCAHHFREHVVLDLPYVVAPVFAKGCIRGGVAQHTPRRRLTWIACVCGQHDSALALVNTWNR